MSTKNDLKSDIGCFFKHIPPNGPEDIIILKGHLLLGQMLRSYISSKVKNPKYIYETQVPFLSLVDIAWSFANLVEINHSTLGHCKGALVKFNTLRNKLAHKLEPDIIKDVSNFINFVNQNLNILFPSEAYKKYKPLPLAILVVYLCTSQLLRFEIPKVIPSYGELQSIAAKIMKKK